MEEVEFITEEEVRKTAENFSIEELIDYKKKLIKSCFLDVPTLFSV